MSTLPPIVPERTTAGIAVDPTTLERVVPESKRADGSVRKEIKIRPGFTPQEDVGRFKTSRQQQREATALPKGHILGWVAPSSQTKTPTPASAVSKVDANGQPLSKAALKNAKRKAKKIADKANAPASSSGTRASGSTALDDEEEEETEMAPAGTVEDAPEAWDDEGDADEANTAPSPKEEAPKAPEAAEAAPAPVPKPSDPAPTEAVPAPEPKPSPTPAPPPKKSSTQPPTSSSTTPQRPNPPSRTNSNRDRPRMQPGVESLRKALGSLSTGK